MRHQATLLQSGEILAGLYQIEAEIGRGTMGVVYRATRVMGGGAVAVKVLYPKHCQDKEQVGRFWQEARLCRKLQHPNVIQVFDFGLSERGLPYFVEEILEGQDLQALLDQGLKLSSPQLIELMLPVCAALSAAHEAGIVHRDLKPANIFVGPCIKLIDFGLAKVKASVKSGIHTNIVGTPAYMSPEQLRGESLDARSDIYALGVIFYQLLCGELPFWGESYLEIGEKILTQPPEEVRQRARDKQIPGALARIAMQCLEKDREDRPKSAQELIERLISVRETLASDNTPVRLARVFLERLQWLQREFKSGVRPVVQKLKLSA